MRIFSLGLQIKRKALSAMQLMRSPHCDQACMVQARFDSQKANGAKEMLNAALLSFPHIIVFWSTVKRNRTGVPNGGYGVFYLDDFYLQNPRRRLV
jgi:hypothetical protein